MEHKQMQIHMYKINVARMLKDVFKYILVFYSVSTLWNENWSLNIP